ncbi:MORC family CW-type zinc finger protein 3-like, partial [Clarias magur]
MPFCAMPGIGSDCQQLARSLKVKELKQRVAHLLVTTFPALDREQVTDKILTQVIDVISPTETKIKGPEFSEQEAHLSH